MGIIIKTCDCEIFCNDDCACSFIYMMLFVFIDLVAMGPTVEVVVPTRAMVSLAATARRSMEAITRALTATLAHITREDTAATGNPSQVKKTLGLDQSLTVVKQKFNMFHLSQVDTARRRLIKEQEEEEEVVVVMVVPVSPIALGPITTTTTTSRLT